MLLKYGHLGIIKSDFIFTHFRLHPQSKSINEGEFFELEFDRLKFSLLTQLDFPKVLLNKYKFKNNIIPLNSNFQVSIPCHKYILASFALFFAERSYIENDVINVNAMINLIIRIKGFNLNKREWKLFILSCVLPHKKLKILKQLKIKFQTFVIKIKNKII